MRRQYRSDHVVDRQTIVAGTHFRQGLTWAEAATGATADVIGAKERTLSARISLDKLAHGCVWIDCRHQGHKDQPYIISLEKQKTGAESGKAFYPLLFARHEIDG
jgi:hypothetical protein